MKRNMDLIREALLKVQQGDPNGSIAGYTDDEIKYHRALAIEVGLLKGAVAKDNTTSTPIPAAVVISDLTWEGHDFIDAIESDTNWAKVKQWLIEGGKQITVETIKLAVKRLFGVAD